MVFCLFFETSVFRFQTPSAQSVKVYRLFGFCECENVFYRSKEEGDGYDTVKKMIEHLCLALYHGSFEPQNLLLHWASVTEPLRVY